MTERKAMGIEERVAAQKASILEQAGSDPKNAIWVRLMVPLTELLERWVDDEEVRGTDGQEAGRVGLEAVTWMVVALAAEGHTGDDLMRRCVPYLNYVWDSLNRMASQYAEHPELVVRRAEVMKGGHA